MMQTILCTGDSHTWGQGAAGLMDSLSPPAVSGDLRQADFSFGSYVNRLRRMTNALTGSSAGEVTAAELGTLPGITYESPCALVGRTPLRIQEPGGLFRLQFACRAEKTTVRVTDETGRTVHLDLTDGRTGQYRNLNWFFENDGPHQMVIEAAEGIVPLYRLEWYAGNTAVINCGIGSCCTSLYRERYWTDYVEALRPSLVVMEAHTINDWLQADGPDAHQSRLEEMIRSLKEMGSRVILLTVSPILGPQVTAGHPAPYTAYVEASRRAAAATGIPLCDANALMTACLEGMEEEQAAAFLFADCWHVNERGHRLYAEAILQAIEHTDALHP